MQSLSVYARMLESLAKLSNILGACKGQIDRNTNSDYENQKPPIKKGTLRGYIPLKVKSIIQQ